LITSIEDLPQTLASSVAPDEAEYVASLTKDGAFPFAVTLHYASLAEPRRDDPVRRQFFPDPREAEPDPFALEDPLGEALYQKAPRLVRRYRDSALLLAGGACAGRCRHCFRRDWAGGEQAFISEAELVPVLAYLKRHPEIREILVSGGDPLTAADSALDGLFRGLRDASPGILLRLCTRMPVTEPGRLGAGTIPFLAQWRPVRMMIHLNHPRELAPETRQALSETAAAGIPVHVQTVLLKGINDDAETLAALFRDCIDLGLSPYYLFQPDLAPGTRHFRTDIRKGLAVYRKLGTLVSGLGLPAYAVDLPGGGGKIRLSEGSIAGEEHFPDGSVYLLRGPNNSLWPYPKE